MLTIFDDEQKLGLIRNSNQLWKIIIVAIIALLCGSVIIFQSFLYNPVGENTTFIAVLVATLLGPISILWGSLSIKCPKCKLKIFWYAVSKLKVNTWFIWILGFEECPKCGYAELKKQDKG